MCVLKWHYKQHHLLTVTLLLIVVGNTEQFQALFTCCAKLEKNAHHWQNSTLLVTKLNASSIQYFLQCQRLLSLSRYSTQFYGKYGLLQSPSEWHSKLSWIMNSQNPTWYSSLKSIPISSSYIHTGLLIFQFIICLNLPSFPCMPHSLPILSLFFNSLLPDKHYKLSNSTLCILLLPFPLSSVQTLFLSFYYQTNSL